MEADELVFFAIGDSSYVDGRQLLRFLRRMRERFKNGEKNELQELSTIIYLEKRDGNVVKEEDEPEREERSGMSLQKRSSFSNSWCRTVRVVVAIDLLFCLILFGFWLAICRGLTCIFR